jgi:hypothetical protein
MDVIGQSRSHILITGEAEDGGVEVRRQKFDAELTFGLEAAQFGRGAMEVAMGLSAGAVDGLLRVVQHGIKSALGSPGRYHAGLNGGTAAQTPGGVNDFGGQDLLDCAFGREVCLEAGAEAGVEILLLGADKIATGIESGGYCVTGDTRLAFGGAGTAGSLRIVAIGGDLSISCHGTPLRELFDSQVQGSAWGQGSWWFWLVSHWK